MAVPPESRLDTVRNLSITRAHFIGVCGSGMKPIAQAFLALGIHVSGSDQDLGKGTSLVAKGARLYKDHAAENLGDPDVVVYSTAIPQENPEFAAAKLRGIMMLHRSEALAWFLHRKTSFLVAGTHGKTTTTTFLTLILEACGGNPWSFVGGHVREFAGNLRLGKGSDAVAEADESDGSFLLLPRHHALITNIEPEHLDYWGSAEALHKGFADFVEGLPADGLLSVNIDDCGIRQLLQTTRRRAINCSMMDASAPWYAGNIDTAGSGSVYTLHRSGVPIGRVRLGVPGRHNVGNSLLAFALAGELGLPIEKALECLGEFRGVDRRFTHYPSTEGWLVIDDYAHHPTEISATIAAARMLADEREGKLYAVFQPHRYSRARQFFDQFAPALSNADDVLVMDVYSAGEKAIAGVSGESLTKVVAASHKGRVYHAPTLENVENLLRGMLKKRDIVLLLGAGSVTRLTHLLAPVAQA